MTHIFSDNSIEYVKTNTDLRGLRQPWTATVDGLMESMSDHIDGKTETFALIPNQDLASPQAQEEMSDDEEESEERDERRVKYPANPTPQVKVDLPSIYRNKSRGFT